VDLGAAKTIKQVDVYNRTDCCTDALSNFNVYTSMDGVTWTLRSHVPGQAARPMVIGLPSVYARYVRIQLAAYATAVTLAEVDVWGYGRSLSPTRGAQASGKASSLVR
jgi:alpha-L-fucosidase